MARPGRARWSRLEAVRLLETALIRAVPRDHLESDRVLRRGRVVVAVTACLGAVLPAMRILVARAPLGVSFQFAPSDPRSTSPPVAGAGLDPRLAGLRPLHLGWDHTRWSSTATFSTGGFAMVSVG